MPSVNGSPCSTSHQFPWPSLYYLRKCCLFVHFPPIFPPVATNCFAFVCFLQHCFLSCMNSPFHHLTHDVPLPLLFPRTTFPFPAHSDLSSCFLPFAYPAARSLDMLCQETAICTVQKPARLFVSPCSFPTDTWAVYLSGSY